MVFHVEVNFGGLPLIIDFVEQSGGQAQEGGLVWEEAGDPSAAFEFLVDPFQGVAGAHASLVGHGQGEDGQALRQVDFHPGGELGSGRGIEGDDLLEAALGGRTVGAAENTANGFGDHGALVESRDKGLGVLLEMELAALPRHGGEDGGACGGQAGVSVTDHELDAAEAAVLEPLEEGAPMDFGFTEGHADAQDGAFTGGIDAQGDEDGAIQELAALADLLVTGIQDQVGESAQGAGSPGLEFKVEVGGALADLGGTDGATAELLDDGRDFAGGDALDVHFGEGQFERLLAADALFQGAGVEVDVAPDLRDAELNGADAGVEGFGFEAVGVALAGFGALIGLGLEGLGALLAHGLVDEQADAFGEAGGALLSQELQNGVQEFRLGLVGRHGFAFGCVC